MGIEFWVQQEPSGGLWEEVAALEPCNPFFTPNYVEATRQRGYRPWLLALRRNGKLLCACPAFLSEGRLCRRLQLDSVPVLQDPKPFWDGLLQLCRSQKIASLMVYSYGCVRDTKGPSYPGEELRTHRTEYVIDLEPENLWKPLRKGHKCNIIRCRKAKVEIRQCSDREAHRVHTQLRENSFQRRRERGEIITAELNIDHEEAFLESGSAEIYQAYQEGIVLSSYLVLLAKQGVFGYTGGSHPEGMAMGCSHFLVYSLMKHFQSKSMKFFSLGGVDQWNKGLEEYKLGFRAKVVKVENTEFYFGNKFKRFIGTTGRTILNRFKSRRS